MPLSKAKNRDRMREIRLHKQRLSLYQSKPVQPMTVDNANEVTTTVLENWTGVIGIDADGNPVYEEG